MTAGANILDGRGNVTGYFGYQKMDPVRSSDRDFGSCQLSYDTMTWTTWAAPGSSNSNYFGPKPGQRGAWYSVLGNQFVERGTADTTPPAVFNSQRYIYMQRGDKRYNAGFMAHVDVNDYVTAYGEFSFMNDQTHQEVAPTALFRRFNVLTDTGNYLINCSNPLLSAQQAVADVHARSRSPRTCWTRDRSAPTSRSAAAMSKAADAPTTTSTPTTGWLLGAQGQAGRRLDL